MNRKITISQFFCRYVNSRKCRIAILSFLPQKICEELSANRKSEIPQILLLQNRLKVEESGQFVKDFLTNKSVFFLFLLWLLTTEAMGIGGLREHSLSWNDKVNAGAKTAKCTSASQ